MGAGSPAQWGLLLSGVFFSGIAPAFIVLGTPPPNPLNPFAHSHLLPFPSEPLIFYEKIRTVLTASGVLTSQTLASHCLLPLPKVPISSM